MTIRTTDTALNAVFLDRWSTRAFDRSDMPPADLATIIDAARFAPSASNYQPWRLLYAQRGDAHWDSFLSLLVPGNHVWAEHASVLFFILSDKFMGAPDRPSRTHSFDAGAAWAMLAVQATMLGYHSHGMAGIDYDKAQQVLNVPETFRIEAAVALGRLGSADHLSEQLRAREVPSDRKLRDEMAYPGPFHG